MGLVFHTKSDQPYDVEIANVGVLAGNAQGGIPVERAAAYMSELQDDDGQPLSGKKLEDAANAFAAVRGIGVKSLKNVDEEKLRVAAGALPQGRTIEDVSAESSGRERAQVEAHREVDEAAPLTTDELPPQESARLPQAAGTEG